MQVKDKVFVLRSTRYGDTDLILNCLNSSGARISLIARGAVKSRKRFGGGILEPTHYIHVTFEDKTSGRNEHPIHTLKEATLLEGFDGLRTDYARIETALHFVRLISEVVKEGEIDSSDIFNLLGNTLRVTQSSTNLEALRTHFEVKLLANQGVLPMENDEQILLATPISEHEKLSIDDTEWARLRGRVKRVLTEYLGQSRSESESKS